jgi:hypothetical protein
MAEHLPPIKANGDLVPDRGLPRKERGQISL